MVTLADVKEAAGRIEGSVVRTPLLETSIRGTRIFLKCECLQTGGAFKLRGASNRLLELNDEERSRGVVAFSSGNHAQGVAIAAERLGIRATIVMPADAPKLKVEGTRAHGAEIIFYDRLSESREAIAQKIATESGSVVVPSFDDPHIIAGQGTAGLEILAQCEEAGASPPPAVAAPVGGGGLLSGLALAMPDSRIIGAEPEGWDDVRRSLEAGEIVPVGPNPPHTQCDAIQTLRTCDATFEILKARKAEIVAVSDADVGQAMRWANERHQLTLEPGGAAALAAVLAGKTEAIDGMVVVLSGGNVDPAIFEQMTAR